MKKTSLFLLFLILILGTALFAQTDVTIGQDTTVNTYTGSPTPYGTWYKSFRQQYLFTAAEIEDAGGGTGPIQSLAFHVENVNTCSPMPNFTIKIKTTTQTALSTTFETGNYSTVFVQNNFLPTIGWNTHSFSQPFVWDGNSNLLIDVSCTLIPDAYSQNASVYYSTTAPVNTCLRAQSDTADADNSATGTLSALRANTRFNMTAAVATNPPNPAHLVSPANGATNISLSTSLNWQRGTGLPSGFKVHLGTSNPPPFVADVGAETTYNAQNLQAETTYYWQIIPYNAMGDATNCPVWSFTTVPDGLVYIGEGNATGTYLPVNTLWGYSYSQTLYLQNEINMPEQRIEKIAYYWDGAGGSTNNDSWTIYMGHTDQGGFNATTDWIPFTELTQVYTGTVEFPAGEGWMEIMLSNPFVYNNTQNLVIATLEDSPSYTYGGSFLNTVATGRSIRAYSDSIVPDPMNPPGGASQLLQGHHPNIMLFFGDLPDGPVLAYTPNALDFGLLMQDNPSDWRNLSIRNTGSGNIALNATNISIIGADAGMFEFDPVNLPANLGPGIGLNVPVRATVSEEGEVSATLRITWNGNNYDVALSATGLPSGLVIIGDGTQISRYPLGCYFGYERSASLYTSNELGLGNRRISALAWYATQALSQAIPTKIYLKTYGQNTVTPDTWANFIAGAIPVFDANDTAITANGWHTISLNNTFDLDSGENLLVLVERNYGGSGAGAGSSAPAVYGTTHTNMHQMVQADSNPPTGTTSAQATRPNLMIFSSSYEATDPPNPAYAIYPQNQATMIPLNPTLSWTSGGGAPSGYKLHFGTTNPPPFVADLGAVTSHTPTNIQASNTYYWQIIPYNDNGEATGCPVWSFSTVPAGMVTIGNGTAASSYPFYSLYEDARTQMLFTAAELIAGGAVPGQILDQIAFDVTSFNTIALNSLMVRVKHTDATTMNGFDTANDELHIGYNGTYSIDSAGWHYFEFDAVPFIWNGGQNLLVDVSFNNSEWSGNSTVNATAAPGMTWAQNTDGMDGATLTGGNAQANRPNTRFIFSGTPSGDPELMISPAAYNFGDINVGENSNKSFRLMNIGGDELTITNIQISGSEYFTLANLPALPITLESIQSTNFTVNYAPANTGTHSATVQITDNLGNRYTLERLNSNSRDTHTVELSGNGVYDITVGDGNQTALMPLNFYWRNSLYETIYSAEEINHFAGLITGIKLYNNFSSNLTNKPVKLWLGSTDQDNLEGGWIPATELTQVFDGTMDFPSGQNEIVFTFDIPYVHPGGNLVFMANRPMDTQYHSSSDLFKTQTGHSNRARNLYSDSTDYNPDAPDIGSTTGIYPKITFQVSESDADPQLIVNPLSYSFGDVNIGGSKSRNIRMMNIGNGVLNVTNIELSGSNAFTLANLPALPVALDFVEFASFDVVYAPVILGTDAATITITDDRDNRHSFSLGAPAQRSDGPGLVSSIQNSRDIHTVTLSGSGVNDITVGEGLGQERMPLDFWYRNSLYETIYTQNEMSNFIGMITGFKLYNNFGTAVSNNPVKFWLGSTTQTDLANGWIPATELELVYDGTMDFPSGENIITFTFDEPYMHLDGGNLVFMANRPMEEYYSSSNYFKTSTGAANRARNMFSDSITYDPNAPDIGTLTSVYPKITFVVIPGSVGHITGVVYGPGNVPLPGVNVTLDGRIITVQTNAQGQFHIPNQIAGDYTISFNKHTYVGQTLNIVVEEDETFELEINMQLMPQVTVSGNIIASDTSQGIAGANIVLSGYEGFNAVSTANGSFSIPGVFAGHTYAYVISASGYTTIQGSIDVIDSNYDMGTLTLNEVAYAPNSVVAELSASYMTVELSWNTPDPNALEIIEGFESAQFPPNNWSQTITNTGAANNYGVYPTWCSFGVAGTVHPSEGNRQAGLTWIEEHQDEWLFTPPFDCPPDAYMRFDTYATLGSDAGDHYYVKISTDNGNSWIVLWDASALPTGTNSYEAPVHIDLSNYAGNHITLAFHALDPPTNDGLWSDWYIDNIYIGNMARSLSLSTDKVSAERSSRANALSGVSRSLPGLALQKEKAEHEAPNRALVGYRVWRLTVGQENNESTWVELTDDTHANTSIEDNSWASLPNGAYKWAVKAVYTAGVHSTSAISNALVKDLQNGNIVGFVRDPNNQGIPGAIVSAGGIQTTTSPVGAYSLTLPAGQYEVTAEANDYHPQTREGIVVAPNQNTTVNFTMIPTSNEDEMIPVTITKLNGNYPNPFNPETTISYDIKEACPVNLEIYNLRGQKVRTLVNDTQAMGRYRLVFNARDDRGMPLSSGVYFYRFKAGDYKATRKMLLME